MRKNKSHHKKRPIDFSFYFPYLSSTDDPPSRQPSTQLVKNKKIRYSSTSTSKMQKKGKISNKNLINTYLPTKQLREGLLNKKKMRQSIQKKLTRQAIDMMNISLSQFKKSFVFNRKTATKNAREQEVGVQGQRQDTEVQKEYEQKCLNSKILLQQSKTNPLVRSKQSRNQSFQQQITFTQPISMAFKNSFDIPGVYFKSNTQQVRKHTTLQKPADSHNIRTISAQTRSTTLKQRHSQNWQRQRRTNIDNIINRKCSNFHQLMAEYYSRMQCSPTFLFSFDSNDTWMKKVLLRRGWSQNKNKHSKAFHLLWTYKVPKEQFYPEQIVNHYKNSHKVTTKSFLNRILHTYKMKHLQPKTYDLDLQRSKFVSEYNKTLFCSFLLQFLDHFQTDFQDEVNDPEFIITELRKHTKVQINNQENQLFQKQLQYLIFICLQVVDKKECKVDLQKLSDIRLTLKSKDTLQSIHEQMILTLLRFMTLLKGNRLLDNWVEGGSQNIWLVKSKSSSKGAGLILSNSEVFLLRQHNRLIQKYIENVLLLNSIGRKKFDIRLWVLLKGNTLSSIYYYRDFYGRVCAQPYRVDKQSLSNSAIHLTNYALNRCSYNTKEKAKSSVIFPDQLFDGVRQQYGIDYQPLFYEKVEHIIHSLKPIFVEELCKESSGNNFEFFGFDLLIDNQLNLHLLQINLSARCEQRNQRLSLMLEQMGQGLLNILQEKGSTTQWRQV